MSWVFVWLLLGIISTLVFVVFAVSLGRNAVIIGRTARRFREEVGPPAAELSRDGAAVSDRAQGLGVPRGTERTERTEGPGVR